MGNQDTQEIAGSGSQLTPPACYCSAQWVDKSILPKKKGWYVTRTEDGEISWRAWGNNAWWKQRKDGWIKSFTGAGEAMDYDWLPSTRRSVDLDMWDLPSLQNVKGES